MDGRPVLGGDIRKWMGDSRGRWEGNTLVIETTDQNGREWLDNVGNFYSANAQITERIAMVDADTLLWEAQIEDPNVYTRPWTVTFPLRRNKTPGFQLIEFACHEGNKSPGCNCGAIRSRPDSRTAQHVGCIAPALRAGIGFLLKQRGRFLQRLADCRGAAPGAQKRRNVLTDLIRPDSGWEPLRSRGDSRRVAAGVFRAANRRPALQAAVGCPRTRYGVHVRRISTPELPTPIGSM